MLLPAGGLNLVVESDEDVHVCSKCNIAFYNIEAYLEHKIKHDNFKVASGS